MKKIATILAIATLISTSAFAQGVSGGAKLGVNMANQTFSGNGTYSSPSFRPGFHVGGYITAMFTEHLGLQPELLYSAQGYKNGTTKVSLNYVTIPVLVRFNVNSFLSFHLGPQFGVLTSAKAKTNSTSTDVKDSFKGSDLAVAGGVTIDLPMKLNFTLRFIKGLSDVNDVPNSTLKSKTFNVQLSVGYRLFGK